MRLEKLVLLYKEDLGHIHMPLSLLLLLIIVLLRFLNCGIYALILFFVVGHLCHCIKQVSCLGSYVRLLPHYS